MPASVNLHHIEEHIFFEILIISDLNFFSFFLLFYELFVSQTYYFSIEDLSFSPYYFDGLFVD